MTPIKGSADCSLNHGPWIEAAGWTQAALAIAVVIARFFTHQFVVGRLWWDDWLMLFALVSFSATDPSYQTDMNSCSA